jgi:hypothetical protein
MTKRYMVVASLAAALALGGVALAGSGHDYNKPKLPPPTCDQPQEQHDLQYKPSCTPTPSPSASATPSPTPTPSTSATPAATPVSTPSPKPASLPSVGGHGTLKP